MILIALFKKFLSKQFIASVEVSNIARCSSKTNELRDIDSTIKQHISLGQNQLLSSSVNMWKPYFWSKFGTSKC